MLTLKAMLRFFEMVSRLKMNFHKSKMVGIETSNSWVSRFTKVLNCQITTIPFTYLGMSVAANYKF